VHWFYDPALTPEQTQFSGSENTHAKALRIREGEQIAITDGRGMVAFAAVVAESPIAFKIHHTAADSTPSPRYHLIQALAKNDRDEMALQAAVELGAASVTPWQASRSIVRWDQKAERNKERWQSIAIEAMKQSQQSHLCRVESLASTKQLKPIGVGVVLDPRAELTLDQLGPSEDFSILVGPEGGITEEELALLSASGFQRVRLGSSVLRASTAGPAAIAALSILHGSFRA
jgi:16S rRNA (uracil1498-N3)-methyltransferase